MSMGPKPGGGSTFDAGSRAERRRGERIDRLTRPRMADITDRPFAAWRAVAEAEVAVSQETLSVVIDGTLPKGDVFSISELAGVMGGKRAADLVPLVHPIALTELLVNAAPDRASGSIRIRVEAASVGPVGVEMEALTAAAVAALTVYDMVRDGEPGAIIRAVRLISSTCDDEDEYRRVGDGPEGARPQRGARIAGRVGPSRNPHVTSRPNPHHRAP